MAAMVCAALDRHRIQAVLSGGAVVSIYSNNEYESYDLDFVRTGIARKVDVAMEELGFVKEGRHWRHPKNRYWVDFPPGPVQVGDAIVTKFAKRETPLGVLRLLAPTECVMDRLAGYYHWDDPQCFEQAVAVAHHQLVDLQEIEAWSRREHSDPEHFQEKFKQFTSRLELSK